MSKKVEYVDWFKPSGSKVRTNAEKATVDHCVNLGWEKDDGKEKAPGDGDGDGDGEDDGKGKSGKKKS